MNTQKEYITPDVDIKKIDLDILTLSETEQWLAPEIEAGFIDDSGTEN